MADLVKRSNDNQKISSMNPDCFTLEIKFFVLFVLHVPGL